MPRAKKRKDTEFQSELTKSVFYYGEPNTETAKRLEEIQTLFLMLVNHNIQLLCDHETEFMLQLVNNDKKDSSIRAFEKENRKEGTNSAFCQNAFEEAFTKLSNRLNNIRLEMIPFCGKFAQSIVLFSLCMQGATKDEMVRTMSSLGTTTKSSFHKECAEFVHDMDDDTFLIEMKIFDDAYFMCSQQYKIPEVRHAEVPLDSRLMKLEASKNIKEPYVISISDPEKPKSLILVPIRLSKDAERRLAQHKPAASVRIDVRGKQLKVSRAFTKKVTKPSVKYTIGVDTGIIDCFYTSDGRSIGSMKDVLDCYQDTVEPAFAYLSDLRNKKRKISHYIHTHKDLPVDVKKHLIAKIDKLEHMIRIADAPYRKNRHYYQMLDHEISSSVNAYIKDCTKDTLTVLEKLDIKEFNKSRKANGMMSTFARGKLQQKMLAELNWHGFDFLEVPPDYTSKACPVCSNIDDRNRNGKVFHCTCCGYKDDADHVGSINVGNRADDKEVLELCEKYKYDHKQMQTELKKLYAKRNEEYKKKHKLIKAV